jgi:chromate transporter
LIYIELFLNFLVIGTVSFGGGYGMISLVRETVLSKGWLTESQFMDFIAVSESTPGPLAVNMATFIGSSQGGILGAFTATLGVVLPSFFIILIIAAVLKNILKYEGVKAVLTGIRPCIVAMIIATAISMGLNIFIVAEKSGDAISPDIRSIIIFFILIAVQLMCGKVLKKKLSPILMIVFSAVLGIVFFGGGI